MEWSAARAESGKTPSARRKRTIQCPANMRVALYGSGFELAVDSDLEFAGFGETVATVDRISDSSPRPYGGPGYVNHKIREWTYDHRSLDFNAAIICEFDGVNHLFPHRDFPDRQQIWLVPAILTGHLDLLLRAQQLEEIRHFRRENARGRENCANQTG